MVQLAWNGKKAKRLQKITPNAFGFTFSNLDHMGYTAVVLGSSGLVGSFVLKELIEDARCSQIYLFNRTSVSNLHPKVHETLVDFNALSEFQWNIKVDVLINCIGTTRKKTPNLKSYEAIDIDIPLNVAKLLIPNGCTEIHAVSSVGANANSSNFYLKIKGTLEQSLMILPIPVVRIYRPSMLMGNRKEYRFGESIGRFIVPLLDFFTFKGKYHSIQASQVAKAIRSKVQIAESGRFVLHYKEMIEAN